MGLFSSTKKKKETDVFQAEMKRVNKILSVQDQQLAMIKAAEDKYEQNKNIQSLILFWENIWNNGGLAFNGSRWTFRLPDLYIKQKRYDDALRILRKIKNPAYQEKVQLYISRIKAKRE